jgi:beta-glucosidase-like glycosyl hydrolase/CubicO group peptidase (beta-lactamase class C family)
LPNDLIFFTYLCTMKFFRIYLFFLFALSGISLSLHAAVTPRLMQHVDRLRMEQWVDSVFATLTAEERLGQLIIPIVDARGCTDAQRKILLDDVEQLHVGGLLFSGCSMSDQAAFTNLAQAHARVPLLITLDGEWGLNMRMKDAPRYPRNMALGCINDSLRTADGTSLRDSLLYEYGREVARQCRAMGIAVNFAPVLDINNNPANPVIGTRSFGDTPEGVIDPALSYARGLEEGGVLSVGKHFPGHGDTDRDSHHTLPILTHTRARMLQFEMEPFVRYIRSGGGGLMVGHLAVPSLETQRTLPASLSHTLITEYLRQNYGFEGLIFTDGLAMEGARRISDVGVKALKAGVDILLDPVPLTTRRHELLNALKHGTLSQSLVDDKCRRVLRYKYLLGLTTALEAHAEAVEMPAARQLSRTLYESSLCLLRNRRVPGEECPIIPFRQLDRYSITAVDIATTGGDEVFRNTLNHYAAVASFTLTDNLSVASRDSILRCAATSGRCIIALHDAAPKTVALARALCGSLRCPYILCFFTSPYRISSYADLIAGAAAILQAHDDSPMAHTVAAEALFGGVALHGRLSVTLPNLFAVGSGCDTERIRLSVAEPEQVGLRSEVLAQIDTLVCEALNNGAFPGCQVLVAKDGYIVYQRAFGYTDYQSHVPVTDRSLYDLASVSKAAATVPAVMMARDDCHLRLNDRFSTYLSSLRGTDLAPITIREALLHETGLPEGYPFYRLVDSLLLRAEGDADFSLQVADGMFLHRSFRDTIFQQLTQLPLKGRGRYRYSCLGFVLLRALVEQCTVQPLDCYLRQRLFAPIGASRLCYNPRQTLSAAECAHLVPTEVDTLLRHQQLLGYVHDELAAYSGGVEGNAGLFGSAVDLVKVLQMLLNGGVYGGDRYITEETCRLFTGTRSAHSRRGLGFDKPAIDRPELGPTAPECPASVYGHTGFTGTCFWVDPENNMIYIFLCNRIHPSRDNTLLLQGNYRTRIQSLLYSAMK